MAIVHHWDLQETSGTTVVDSVGGNNGTLGGGNTLGITGPGGSLTNAVDFNTTSTSAIPLASAISLLGSEDWSIACWAKQDLDYNDGMILGDTTTAHHFWLNNVNGIQFRANTGTQKAFGIDAATRLKFSHYVMYYNFSANTLSLRVDGALFSTQAIAPATLTSFEITHLGKGYNNDSFNLDGQMADLRIYDHILSVAENEALVALGTTNLTIDNIADDQFYQRPTSGPLTVTVSGTSVTDEVIEYQVDTGTWQTLATASGGSYSGTADVSSGNHTINVRRSSDVGTIVTVDIHIGDAFGWFGQSNPDGRFTNSQPYTGSLGFWIYDQDDAWIAGSSGYKSPSAALFSVLSRLATLIEASTGVPVAFICETLGGTGIVDFWGSNPPGTQYTKAVDAINDSGINGLRGILFDSGENDSIQATVAAALIQSTLEAMHDDMQVATGLTFPLILAQTGTTPTALAGKLDAVRQGQRATVDNNSDIFFGAIGYDRSSLHWVSDTEAATYASRYAIAVDAALFGSATGTPPRLVSAVVDGTTVTLTYDRDLEAATSYTANAWTFDDGGLAIVVTAAVKTGNRIAVLTITSAPTSTARTLTFAFDNEASGDDVPRGLGGQPVLPEAALATSDARAPVWEVLSVKQVRRVISIS